MVGLRFRLVFGLSSELVIFFAKSKSRNLLGGHSGDAVADWLIEFNAAGVSFVGRQKSGLLEMFLIHLQAIRINTAYNRLSDHSACLIDSYADSQNVIIGATSAGSTTNSCDRAARFSGAKGYWKVVFSKESNNVRLLGTDFELFVRILLEMFSPRLKSGGAFLASGVVVPI